MGDGHNVLAACGIMPDWNGDGMDELWAYITQSDSSFTGVYVFDGNADWINGADLQPLSDASYFLVTGSNAPVSVFRKSRNTDLAKGTQQYSGTAFCRLPIKHTQARYKIKTSHA